MSLTLHVDTEAWRAHLFEYVASHPAVVPVVKGNGYGFGNTVLAAAAKELGVSSLAVGTYAEIAEVEAMFGGGLLVMSPWRPWVDDARLHDPRVIHTVSRLEDLRVLAERGDRPRVVVEVLTSMRRHGIEAVALEGVTPLLDRVQFEGWALHLPLAGDSAAECLDLRRRIREIRAERLWVSHLSPAKVAELGLVDVRLRVGTALWLGRKGARKAKARVLDVHGLRRGQRYGYRQRRAPSDGYLIVVAGGTSHGIALEAPTPAANVYQRGVSLAKGGLGAVGWALSPFRIAGRQRWFAEPPHMQCSLVWLPGSVRPPSVGDELDVDVRLTTTAFDRISWD
jgi:Alanine racemase, N-terminal domain